MYDKPFAMVLTRPRLGLLLLAALAVAACRSLGHGKPPPPPPLPVPSVSPTPGPPEDEQLVVKKVDEEIIVAAWAEPARLPEGGGQAQVLVRVQKRGGARFPDVEVRLRASNGFLFSAGRILITDHQGMTRDRLTTKTTATITLNAGGTRYRFQVPVAEKAPEP